MRLFLISAILLFYSELTAQSFVDNGLLFGRTSPGGSARMQALGGTQVALGGDYSTALSNPAGLGMYNRSELTFSMATNFKDYQTSYLGSKTNSSDSKFNIPGFSLVLHFEPAIVPENNKGFLGGSLGITFTRINDLNHQYNYSGTNSESSIIDYFINEAFFIAPDDPDDMLVGGDAFYNITALAYNNYLIDTTFNQNGDLFYISPLDPNPGETRTVNQKESISRKGAQYQWSIAYGANFSDKLFVGGNIGITTLRYELEQTYRESDFTFSQDLNYKPLDYFSIGETLEIKGSGVNLTLGLTYRPVNFIQVGASFTTPTLYQVTDTYFARVEAEWNDFYYEDGGFYLNSTQEQFDQSLLSEYALTTPLKFATGIAFLSKFGFISGDIEFVDYGKAKYSSEFEGDDYSFENSTMRSLYQSVINFRIGAEFRYEKFRFRGGYSQMGNPYKEDIVNAKVKSISGGLGFRGKRFFTDLALISSKTNSVRIPYSAFGLAPVAEQKQKTFTAMLTVGLSF